MNDGVKVLVYLTLRPDQVEMMLAMLPDLQRGTLARPGVRVSQALRDPSRPTALVFLDEFDNVAASEAYFAWRKETGTLDRLNAMLSEPVRVETWPVTIEQ